MKKVTIEEVDNGYIVNFEGGIKNGQKVFKNTEEIQMLESIGEHLLGQKIKAEVK